MRQFLLGVISTLALLGAGAAYVWFERPDLVPYEWRATSPETVRRDGPAVYRWRDDAGVTQWTDVPPKGRPYDTVRIDPNAARTSGRPAAD